MIGEFYKLLDEERKEEKPTPTFLYNTDERRDHKVVGVYLCRCGVEFTAVNTYVKQGNTSSCGCWQKQRSREVSTTHGMWGTSMYRSWVGMRQRCYNPNNKDYSLYGGSGVRVCDRWLSFNNFVEDMEETHFIGAHLDRICSRGDYEESNCQWLSGVDNSRKVHSDRHEYYQNIIGSLLICLMNQYR